MKHLYAGMPLYAGNVVHDKNILDGCHGNDVYHVDSESLRYDSYYDNEYNPLQ